MDNELLVEMVTTTPVDAQVITGLSVGTKDYNELNNKPTLNGDTIQGDMELDIPSKTSDLDNDLEFVELSDLENEVITPTRNKFIEVNTAIAGKQDKLTETQINNINDIPNKANRSELDAKQDKLTIDTELDITSENPVTNKAICEGVGEALEQKQDALTEGQLADIDSIENKLDMDNVKTINGESIVGSGDITIQGGSGYETLYTKTFEDSTQGSFYVDLGGEYTELTIETISPADTTRGLQPFWGNNPDGGVQRLLANVSNNIYTSARYFKVDVKCFGGYSHSEWCCGNKGVNDYHLMNATTKTLCISNLQGANGISQVAFRITSGTIPEGMTIRIGGRK